MRLTRNHLLVSALALAVGCASASSATRSSPHPAPAAPEARTAPSPDTAARVDEMLRAEWTKSGITPAPRVDDARFARRASLDVIGTLPTPEQVEALERSTDPEKRARFVAGLLASPQYAEHWAVHWDELLLGGERQARVDRAGFRAWLRDRFARGTPWNELVFALVSATGRNSDGGRLAQDYGFATADEGGANPAVNWGLRYVEAPQDFAGAASRTFLGVQIQCAQCHDHKTEKWTQEQFREFASCFARTRIEIVDKGNVMGHVRRVDVKDVDRVPARFRKDADLAAIAQAPPRALDGSDLSKDADARRAMAAWMTSKDNPWFAQAIVNRTWAHFMGRGFVDPVDDLRPSNPATAPEVLAVLADDFVQHGYDLRRLAMVITSTEAYQRAAAPPAADADRAAAEKKLWSRFRVRPLGPEELVNAIVAATDLEGGTTGTRVDLDVVRRDLARRYRFLFDVDEEIDRDAFQGTIAQALTLLNGSLTGAASSELPGGALDAVLSAPTSDAEKIALLYRRALARAPSPEETTYWVQYVSSASGRATRPGRRAGRGDPLRGIEARAAGAQKDPRARAYEDVLWALLNSSEFVFNH